MPYTLVLIPALNEEIGVGLTIAEFKAIDRNLGFLVVDGNSRDNTVHAAKSLGADVLYQTGKGKGDAIDCALRHVSTNPLYVIMADGDYTYPAEYFPRMIEILEQDPNVGMVCGNRFNSHTEIGALKNMFYFGNRLIALTHNKLNGLSMRDPLTGLRAIRWDVIKNWTPKSDGFDIEVELNCYVKNQGYEIVEIDIPYRNRIGEKKLKLRHGITIMRRIFNQSITELVSY